MQVEFNPEVLSYRELLEVFWRSHEPCRSAWSTQYKSAVFVHDEEQRRVAEEMADKIAVQRERPVLTEILPFSSFTLAEAYHQKYSLRRLDAVEREFEAIYPDLDAFVRSTAVTRANAAASGALSAAEFEPIAKELGLSQEALAELTRRLRK